MTQIQSKWKNRGEFDANTPLILSPTSWYFVLFGQKRPPRMRPTPSLTSSCLSCCKAGQRGEKPQEVSLGHSLWRQTSTTCNGISIRKCCEIMAVKISYKRWTTNWMHVLLNGRLCDRNVIPESYGWPWYQSGSGGYGVRALRAVLQPLCFDLLRKSHQRSVQPLWLQSF